MIDKNARKIMYGILLTFALCLTMGIALASFVADVVGNADANDVTVKTGNLLLNYEDGNVLDVTGIFPGKTYYKDFTVENIGTLPTTFNIGFSNVENTFLNDELVVSITCTSYDASTNIVSGTCDSYDETVLPAASSSLYTNISIDVGKKYIYNLAISFKETNSSQNYNQGAIFKAKIDILE